MILKRNKYLQVAMNSTLSEARSIISRLPISERIIIEAGTPLIKRFGMQAISELHFNWSFKTLPKGVHPYIVADLKTMDRAATEVEMAANAGASGLITLGLAPVETINAFIDACKKRGVDSMVDMMNVEQPVKILRKLKKLPDVVILHRGVDEETYNKNKPIPYLQINKLRGTFDVKISIAGGDTVREVQRSIFNGADIVVVWKEFYTQSQDTTKLAEEFLKEIK